MTRIFKDPATGRVSGALGIRNKTGGLLLFRCKAIILATGGCGRVYEVTSNSYECTGDGLALAYRAGAELMDMEMIQFHPTGMIYPEGVRGLLVTEAVRGEGGILTNVKGERFMERYDPKRKELSARDVVARSIYTEIARGEGDRERGGLPRHHAQRGRDYIRKKLPSMYSQFLEFAGVDITKEKMEVAPTVHYQMGGVRVEPETGSTRVAGLYAAGEVACGLHGANRLGGNSLGDILVFGRRAGLAAAEYAKSVAPGDGRRRTDIERETARILAPFGRSRDGREPVRPQGEDRGGDVEVRRDSPERGRPRAGAGGDPRHRGGGAERSRRRARGPTTSRGSTLSRSGTWSSTARRSSGRRWRGRRAGERTRRSDFPKRTTRSWLVNIITREEGGQDVQELVPCRAPSQSWRRSSRSRIENEPGRGDDGEKRR